MASHRAMRHAGVAAVAAATIPANLLLGVSWQLALVAGAAVLLFGELSPRLLPARHAHAQQSTSASYPLTRKEVEVGVLVAKGMRNKEIARQLFNSERTIDNHVMHIYNKLNINSRVELALWFRERGLLSETSSPKDSHLNRT
jgi:DNA-binding NarL/FixJ family response regulator